MIILATGNFCLTTDAYLYAVLNWSVGARVSLSRYPAIKEYHRRLRIRPSIAKAYQEELLVHCTYAFLQLAVN